MARLRADELRGMSIGEMKEKLRELREELSRERARTAAGGSTENPMRIRELRRAIARVLTVIKEEELRKKRKD
ncbi:MAG: 50S ribosomal protein L29 [Candidatus Hadarchaeales archaeon]